MNQKNQSKHNHQKSIFKKLLVEKIFADASNTYDLMNDLMSFGLHRWWKKQLLRQISPYLEEVVVDIACGTMDIAIAIAKIAQVIKEPNAQIKIIGCDPSQNMLDAGKRKISLYNNIEIIKCSAENIPMNDRMTNCVVTGFGPRNFIDLEQSMKEISRILKPQGHLFSLELFYPTNLINRAIYKYLAVPYIKALSYFMQKYNTYQYLIDSISSFEEANYISSSKKNNLVLIKRKAFHPFPAIIHTFIKNSS